MDVKRIARAALPPSAVKPLRRAFVAVAGDAYQERQREQLEAISADGTVTAGPFTGMWIGHDTTWGGVSYYLTGTYEDELAPFIESEVARTPPLLIDVGCAEGYYAVGFARRSPMTKVIAADSLAAARDRCRDVAVRNGVEVDVIGGITASSLNALLVPGALVICDCEGAEAQVLDPTQAPMLAQATILVELHDFVDPTISRTITKRFEDSHAIEIVAAQPKTLRHYPHLQHLAPADAWNAIQEHRPGVMEWALLRPKPGQRRPQEV
jgi:precorrin-6B methylase 2